MRQQHCLLPLSLDLHKSHRRKVHRLETRIRCIILVRLDIRLDNLCLRHPDLKSQSLQAPTSDVRAAASPHTHRTQIDLAQK